MEINNNIEKEIKKNEKIENNEEKNKKEENNNNKNSINLEERNEIIIEYNIKREKKVKIFGYNFIKNNKNICKIIYEDKEYELTEYFDIKNIKNDILKIKLKNIN